MKIEDTKVLRRERAKPSKTTARSSLTDLQEVLVP